MKLSELHSKMNGGKRRLKPKKGDIFFINIDGVGHIPGMVAKDDMKYGSTPCFLIYIYNIVLNHKNEKFEINKGDLLMPPCMVLRNNWEPTIGFEHQFTLETDKIDVFLNHCFGDDVQPGIYFDEFQNRCEYFEPFADNSLVNVTVIAWKIMKIVNGIEVERD
ncbi:hypothetical protein FORMB_12070 [Formosa sp. Hel1_33_131]|uniref:hypothetical protein n=1 Tax=Formosa sp. Hel1_33_131 TaxID=1336794 RepID=UPI00084E31ED|nr:hypothetical protein [Formosa sp. Hel1_33_131]AOR28253.1 hypothetical protein FORMB_12070 [Formosa sp. Hel1_33_131]